MLNVQYKASHYVYLVNAEGFLRSRVLMDEKISALTFDKNDDRFFASSEKSISEFFVKKDS